MIHRPIKRRLLVLLDAAARGEPVSAREAHDLCGKLRREWEPRRNEAAVARRAARLAEKEAARLERRDEIGEIRAAVIARCGGRCEVCGSNIACSLDHWLSGNGRRREQESIASTWWLCGKCNGARQANRPNAKHWNDLFQIHAERNGYPVVRHVEHLQVVGGS